MKCIRVHYLDASAIVKLFVDEPGSDVLRKYFDNESCFSTTSVCFSEALGVLKVKRFHKEVINDEQYFGACDELLSCVASGTIDIVDVEINDRMVFVEVENIVRKYNDGKSKKKTIDIADAFQIVSVQRDRFSKFEGDSKPILITADQSLAVAARSEGLRVWNCEKEPPLPVCD